MPFDHLHPDFQRFLSSTPIPRRVTAADIAALTSPIQQIHVLVDKKEKDLRNQIRRCAIEVRDEMLWDEVELELNRLQSQFPCAAARVDEAKQRLRTEFFDHLDPLPS